MVRCYWIKGIDCELLAKFSNTYSEELDRSNKDIDAELDRTTAIQRQKETEEMVNSERNSLQELMKYKITPDDVNTGSDSGKKERWEARRIGIVDRAKKRIALLNTDPKKYFDNITEYDRQERAIQAEVSAQDADRRTQAIDNY